MILEYVSLRCDIKFPVWLCREKRKKVPEFQGFRARIVGVQGSFLSISLYFPCISGKSGVRPVRRRLRAAPDISAPLGVRKSVARRGANRLEVRLRSAAEQNERSEDSPAGRATFPDWLCLAPRDSFQQF